MKDAIAGEMVEAEYRKGLSGAHSSFTEGSKVVCECDGEFQTAYGVEHESIREQVSVEHPMDHVVVQESRGPVFVLLRSKRDCEWGRKEESSFCVTKGVFTSKSNQEGFEQLKLLEERDGSQDTEYVVIPKEGSEELIDLVHNSIVSDNIRLYNETVLKVFSADGESVVSHAEHEGTLIARHPGEEFLSVHEHIAE